MSAAPPAVEQPTEAGALTLGADEAELVAAEATSASKVLGEPRRFEAERLADAARSGEVPKELLGVLAEVLTASLVGGRARRLYKAEGEKSLNAVLAKTPAGRELQEGLGEVNAALQTLAGRRLEGVRVAMRRPGKFTVVLTAENFTITLGVTAEGVTVESLSA